MSLLTIQLDAAVTTTVATSAAATGSTPTSAIYSYWVYGFDFEVTEPCVLLTMCCLDLSPGHQMTFGTNNAIITSGTQVTSSDRLPVNASLVPGQVYTVAASYGKVGSYTLPRVPVFDYNSRFFESTLPAPLKYIRNTKSNGSQLITTPASSIIDTKVTGLWELAVQHTEPQTILIPKEPDVVPAIRQFTILLPAEWRVPDMKEWEIQYSTSHNGADWSTWQTLAIQSPLQVSYTDSNVDPAINYRYRYQVRQKVLQSNWSEQAQPGSPIADSTNLAVTPGSVGTPELADGAVETAKLDDHAVTPIKMSNTPGDVFIFPDEAKAPQFRATGAGYIFPDGSVQATAATGAGTVRKYAGDLGSISAAVPITITHNLGTQDVAVVVYQKSNGETVFVDVLADTVNTVQLTFGASYGASLYRVVVIA